MAVYCLAHVCEFGPQEVTANRPELAKDLPLTPLGRLRNCIPEIPKLTSKTPEIRAFLEEYRKYEVVKPRFFADDRLLFVGLPF